MNINLEYYRVFAQVARFSSITLAAEQLHISQPAVSRTIRQLEQAFGTALLVRTPRGVLLTPEGETLYEHVRAALEQLTAGEQSLENTLSLESGVLCIGASEMTFHGFLLPYLDTYHRRHPRIHMRVMNSTIPETMRAVSDGRIDVGVVITPPQPEKRLRVTPVHPIHEIAIAGPQFSQLKNRMLNWEEVLEQPTICHGTGTASRMFLDSFFAGQGLSFAPEFSLASADLITPFVERNFGVGLVMREFALPSIESGRVFEVNVQPPIPSRTISLITSGERVLPRAAQAFLRLVQEEEQKERPKQ